MSGTGSPLLDCGADGRYNPCHTAQREAFEEATGPLLPDVSWITFFGLARAFKARFPFLFGELRLPMTASQLLSQVPPQSWESRGLVAIPFTIAGPTNDEAAIGVVATCSYPMRKCHRSGDSSG